MAIEENLVPQLQKALDELKGLGVTESNLVERAVKLDNGQSMTGILPDGSNWKLTREAAGSFRIETHT